MELQLENEITKNRQLKINIGKRLTEFRQAGMARIGEKFDQFINALAIPGSRYSAAEKGQIFLPYTDLVKISRHSGLNLNWLLDQNGGMFYAREKEMESLICAIEEDPRRRSREYVALLKSMRTGEMEDFMFNLYQAAMDLLARLLYRLEDEGQIEDLLNRLVQAGDY